MSAVTKKSFTEQIVLSLEEDIKNNVYPVGSKIPAEPEIAAMFGVSKNTAREAIQSLIHAGLLEARQGDGTYVMAKDRLEVEFNKRLNNSDMVYIQEVRKIVEKQLIICAAKRRTEQELGAIKVALERRTAASSSPEGYANADMDFHLIIAEAAHNEILSDIYKYIYKYIFDMVLAKRQKITDKNSKDVNVIHKNIYRAIAAGDEKMAAKAADELMDFEWQVQEEER